MAGSVNKVTLLGNLGRDPEVRFSQSGDKIANLSIATSETWNDKSSGERKEKTEWHRVVVFNKFLADIAEKYLKKGSQVFIEGKIKTRSWEDQQGQKRYTTEVVADVMQLLDRPGSNPGGSGSNESQSMSTSKPSASTLDNAHAAEKENNPSTQDKPATAAPSADDLPF